MKTKSLIPKLILAIIIWLAGHSLLFAGNLGDDFGRQLAIFLLLILINIVLYTAAIIVNIARRRNPAIYVVYAVLHFFLSHISVEVTHLLLILMPILTILTIIVRIFIDDATFSAFFERIVNGIIKILSISTRR